MSKTRLFILCWALASVSCSAALKGYRDGELKGREDSLKRVLWELRDIIKQYSLDQGGPPQKLDDVVKGGYINLIPEDPITGKADWIVVMYNCPPQTSCKEGVKDVHSASREKSIRGDPYSEW